MERSRRRKQQKEEKVEEERNKQKEERKKKERRKKEKEKERETRTRTLGKQKRPKTTKQSSTHAGQPGSHGGRTRGARQPHTSLSAVPKQLPMAAGALQQQSASGAWFGGPASRGTFMIECRWYPCSAFDQPLLLHVLLLSLCCLCHLFFSFFLSLKFCSFKFFDLAPSPTVARSSSSFQTHHRSIDFF